MLCFIGMRHKRWLIGIVCRLVTGTDPPVLYVSFYGITASLHIHKSIANTLMIRPALKCIIRTSRSQTPIIVGIHVVDNEKHYNPVTIIII